MSQGLRILPGERPDAIDVELWQLGEVKDPERAAAIEAYARESGLLDELAEARAAWATAPALPLPARRRRGVPTWGRALLAAVALLTATAAGAAWWSKGEPVEEARAMGGLAVDLAPTREGRPLPRPWRPAAGDRVHVKVTAPRDGWMALATVQDDGGVSVLVSGSAAPVTAGRPYTLDGAVQLDDHGGREWLVVTIADAPAGAGEVERRALSLLDGLRSGSPAPAGTATFEVTRSR